jgi:two-component system sensor histidine kinase ArlS
MPVKIRITLLFTLLVWAILTLVCGSVYYFSYTNRIKDIQTRLANRAITTGRLLSQTGVFDQALIRKIDSSTSVAMRDKVVEAYDAADSRIYWYSDKPADTIRTDKGIIDQARADKSPIYFRQGSKDGIAFYYLDENASFVIIAAAYDEAGNDKLRHLRLVLTLSFVGGILISVIGGYLFSISLLRPLRRISDEVNEISARNLARRIRSAGTVNKDEWRYLADTLNQLLNRLQESFEIQGRFIANHVCLKSARGRPAAGEDRGGIPAGDPVRVPGCAAIDQADADPAGICPCFRYGRGAGNRSCQGR